MSTLIITSHHDLRRDILSAEESKSGAQHRVMCDSCNEGPMTLHEAQRHAETTPRNPTPTLHRLFTIY
jgi:hypothetical protein